MSLINNDEHDRGEEIITDTEGLRCVKHSKAVRCIKGFQSVWGLLKLNYPGRAEGSTCLSSCTMPGF